MYFQIIINNPINMTYTIDPPTSVSVLLIVPLLFGIEVLGKGI